MYPKYFYITEFESKEDNLKLKFKRPYKFYYFRTYLDYCIEDENLGLYLAESSLKELINQVKEELIVAWILYVKCDISELSNDAIELRNVLLDNLEEI